MLISYIENRFDFSDNNCLAKLSKFSLNNPINFENLTEIIQSSVLENSVNIDECYEEFCLIKQSLNSLVEKKDLSALEKWTLIFKDNPGLKNMLLVFQYIASIPTSNAASERVVSLCDNTWNDNRNRLLVDRVKSELQIKVNCNESCSEFYHTVLKNKKLLRAPRSQEKYSFIKKKTSKITSLALS